MCACTRVCVNVRAHVSTRCNHHQDQLTCGGFKNEIFWRQWRITNSIQSNRDPPSVNFQAGGYRASLNQLLPSHQWPFVTATARALCTVWAALTYYLFTPNTSTHFARLSHTRTRAPVKLSTCVHRSPFAQSLFGPYCLTRWNPEI